MLAEHSGVMLAALENLSRFHREHEKFYSEAPLRDSIALQEIARTLQALAERWSQPPKGEQAVENPFAGAPDINDERAIEARGVLFMESGGPPAEIVQMRAELSARADAAEATGDWLGGAMENAWTAALALLDFPELADLLGERHRIIANDTQNASTMMLISNQLRRAGAILDRLDLSTEAVRDDLAGPVEMPRYLFSASELIAHAADLTASSAILVHENERRWRIFNQRVTSLRASQDDGGRPADR